MASIWKLQGHVLATDLAEMKTIAEWFENNFDEGTNKTGLSGSEVLQTYFYLEFASLNLMVTALQLIINNNTINNWNYEKEIIP